MILATHIIGARKALGAGLSPTEREALIIADVSVRWSAIKDQGTLFARKWLQHRDWAAPSRSFFFDDLAGDDCYIFLEVPSRYFEKQPAIYGWQFDAEQLVQWGAFVCAGDLASDYERIIDEVCSEVAQTLPTQPYAPEAVADALSLFGTSNPHLMDFLQNEFMDEDDLYLALSHGKDGPGVSEAQNRIRERCTALQQQRRVTGEAALNLLRRGDHCELLVPDRLPIVCAVTEIQGGVIIAREGSPG